MFCYQDRVEGQAGLKVERGFSGALLVRASCKSCAAAKTLERDVVHLDHPLARTR